MSAKVSKGTYSSRRRLPPLANSINKLRLVPPPCSRNYFSPRNFLPSDYIKATKRGNTQFYDVRLDNRGNTGNSILGISGFLEFNKCKSSHKFNFGQFSISMKETLKVTFLGYLSALRKESVPSLGTRPIYILVSDNPDMVFLAVEGNNVAKKEVC